MNKRQWKYFINLIDKYQFKIDNDGYELSKKDKEEIRLLKIKTASKQLQALGRIFQELA